MSPNGGLAIKIMTNSNVATWQSRFWPDKESKQWCVCVGASILIGILIAECAGWRSRPDSNYIFACIDWLLLAVALGLLGYGWWNAVTELLGKIKTIIRKIVTSLVNFVRSIFSGNNFIRCLCERSWRCFGVVVFFVAGLSAVLFLIAKYCFGVQWCALPICRETYYFDYFLFAIFLISVSVVCALSNEIWTHRLRRMDRSEVRALILDAGYRIAENKDKSKRDGPLGAEQVKNIQNQKDMLLKGLGNKSDDYVSGERSPYTEYDVLTFDQSLLHLYSAPELLARSDTLLSNLREYADDEERQYAREKFNRHKDKINHLKSKLESALEQEKKPYEIKDGKAEVACKKAENELRAYLVELLEHIAGVDRYWFTGQAIARSLVVCSSMALVIFFLMGILPLLDKGIRGLYEVAKDGGFGLFNVVNYAFLAASGAYAGVLGTMMREKELDLGEDAGKRAAYRALIGGAMGLAAGALAYALAAAGLIGDDTLDPLSFQGDTQGPSRFQETCCNESFEKFRVSVYAGIIYSFIVGLTFDRFYERVKGMGQ